MIFIQILNYVCKRDKLMVIKFHLGSMRICFLVTIPSDISSNSKVSSDWNSSDEMKFYTIQCRTWKQENFLISCCISCDPHWYSTLSRMQMMNWIWIKKPCNDTNSGAWRSCWRYFDSQSLVFTWFLNWCELNGNTSVLNPYSPIEKKLFNHLWNGMFCLSSLVVESQIILILTFPLPVSDSFHTALSMLSFSSVCLSVIQSSNRHK